VEVYVNLGNITSASRLRFTLSHSEVVTASLILSAGKEKNLENG